MADRIYVESVHHDEGPRTFYEVPDELALMIRKAAGGGGSDTLAFDQSLAVVIERWAETERDAELAIAHDRQPYPTAHAYERACEAHDRYRKALRRVTGNDRARACDTCNGEGICVSPDEDGEHPGPDAPTFTCPLCDGRGWVDG